MNVVSLELLPIDRSGCARRRALLTAASSVQRERVEWLWPQRIPLGAVSLIVGDPGLGKSMLTCWIAARLSREGKNSIFATAEDSIAAVVRPRLEAAAADLERVTFIRMVDEAGEDGLLLPEDTAELEACVREEAAVFVAIDPLTAHLPSQVNSWRDQSVRLALAPLHRMAERQGCSVTVVAHLNAPSLRFGIESIVLPATESEPDVETARLTELGESAHRGEALLATRGDPEERSAVDEAALWLEDLLCGLPVAATEVQAAARKYGISEKTLRRAKNKLGVQSTKAAFGGGWEWSLRQGEDGQTEWPPSQDGQVGHLRENPEAMRSSDGVGTVENAEDGQSRDMATLGTDNGCLPFDLGTAPLNELQRRHEAGLL
jgi:hypothetical protein